MKALTCLIQSMKKFAANLVDDYDAVKASMMMEVSNGPVEGLNNKLNMLKSYKEPHSENFFFQSLSEMILTTREAP